jgi:hypothetical protein
MWERRLKGGVPALQAATPAREDVMKRYPLLFAVLVGVAVFTVAAVALAQSGHFLTGGGNAPLCVDMGTQLACSGKVAGLGGTTFEITVEASAVASIECRNPGGNVAPGQDTSITATGTSGPLPTPRNGQFRFTIMTTMPVVPNFPTCPNPQWRAEVVDVEFGDATLSLFEDGVLVAQVIVPLP